MSTETTTKSQTAKKVMRKATFTVKKDKGLRIFTPVNKRAHKWAKKVGKRTRLTVADMQAIKELGKVKLAAYDATGTLKTIKL